MDAGQITKHQSSQGQFQYSSPILITASYEGQITSWNTMTPVWRADRDIPAQKDVSVNRVSISEDGRLFAAAASNGVRLFDYATFELVNFIEEKSNVTAIGFQINGEFIFYTTESGMLCIYDIHTKLRTILFSGLIDINCAEISPNQSEIFIGDALGNVHEIDLRLKQSKTSMCGTKNVPVRALAVSSNGFLLAAGDATGDLYWWSLAEDDVN